MIDIDRLINSEERLNKYLDYLIEILASDYHYSFKDLIARRLRETVYIFDSLPRDSYYALKCLGFNPKVNKDFYKYYLEHKDYLVIEKNINKEFYKKYDRSIRKTLNITASFYKNNRDVINDLDYQYFSSIYEEYYDDENFIKVIDEYRKKYLETCKKIDLVPLVDQKKIDSLMKNLDCLCDYSNYKLINSTLFGKRMKEKIGLKFKVNPSLQNIYLRDLLDTEENVSAFTTTIKNKTLIYHPLFSNYNRGSLDLMLLHEMIHSLERTNDNFGLDIKNLEQTIFNELRTQTKAIKTKKKLRKEQIYIFDMDNSVTRSNSTYDNFIPLVSSFLDEYKEIIDYVAITNRMSMLYRFFSRDGFASYTNLLESIHELYRIKGCNDAALIIDDNKDTIKRLEKTMKLTKK